ncbi:MAG TPA: methylthioribulose 1-phosphate dehydratase [Chiayiivirga sp.]|nr:methylthioribulose 1-phosphate dehydratase [Chiayiivirga sp.]
MTATTHPSFAPCAQALASLAAELARRDLTPATSSNFSMRLDADHAVITISGRDKGALGIEDFMVVDSTGQAVGTDARPSAETGLHVQVYRHFPEAGCVLHTHSRNQTVASLLWAAHGGVRLAGYELLKAFHGNHTHETAMTLPILPNNQDIAALATQVEPLLAAGPIWGYLIAGHGLYVWGRDANEAKRHLDAIEFLLGCELDLTRLRP